MEKVAFQLVDLTLEIMVHKCSLGCDHPCSQQGESLCAMIVDKGMVGGEPAEPGEPLWAGSHTKAGNRG